MNANNVNNVNDENKLLKREFSKRQNLNRSNVNGENKSPIALDLQILQERARKIKENQIKMNSKYPSNNFKELDNNDTKQTKTGTYKEENQNRKFKFLNLYSRKIYFYKY